jgi:hypothetical protein
MAAIWVRRLVGVGVVAGAGLVALAAVPGSKVVATPSVGIVNVIGSGSGSGMIMLTNTGSSGTATIQTIGRAASCDTYPTGMMIGGGPPVPLGPLMSRTFLYSCGSNQPPGMTRCLFQGSDTSGDPLVDWMGVCENTTTPSLANNVSGMIAFGNVTIGTSSARTFDLTNNGSAAISRLFFQIDDLDGNFVVSTPCTIDAPYCDGGEPNVGSGGTMAITVKCQPNQAAALTAHLHIDSDQHSYMPPITLTCTGDATTQPAIDINPPSIDLPTPIEVLGGSASAVVHVRNAGGGTLMLTNVQIDDVDTGAAMDWTYTASGQCTGTIGPATCMLAANEQVDVNLVFDPSTLFSRRASLLISYTDTQPQSTNVPLNGTGLGATLELVDNQTIIDFGVVPVSGMSTIPFRLTNRGNRDTVAMLGLTPPGAPFSLMPATMATVAPAPAMPTTINAKCAPTAAGMFTTTINAMGSDTFASMPITINAMCEGSTQELYANPSSLQFGEVRRGTAMITRTITLLDATPGPPLTLTGAPQLDAPNPNITLGTLSQMTTPATFDIHIDPQLEGGLANKITVMDTAGETLKIPISGSVVVASYATPTMLDLGAFCIDLSTASSNVSLTSTGTGTIGLTAPTLAAGAASQFDLAFASPSTYPHVLAAGGVATVSLTPSRQSVASTPTDDLVWHTDVAGETTATTSITAKFVDSGGAIAPGALDFGKVPIHVFEDDGQRVMIQNCNSTALQLDAPIIKAPFSIDSPDFPTMLAPSQTATFSVGFHPTREDHYSDTLVINSPQLPGTPLVVVLSGDGVTGSNGDDGGSGSNHPPATSFYACSGCASGRHADGWPIPAALAVVALRRRRRRSRVR